MTEDRMSAMEIEYELERARCVIIFEEPENSTSEDSDGEPLTVGSFLSDINALHSPGELARLGAALESFGKLCTEESRNRFLKGGIQGDSGVLFQWIPDRNELVLKTGLIESMFPFHQHNNLYELQFQSGYVRITLPK